MQYRSTVVAGVLLVASVVVSVLPRAHVKARLDPASFAWVASVGASTAERDVEAATARDALAASRARHTYVVAALGDSITDARSGGGGYVKDLARMCPKSRFDAYGIGGQRVGNLRARMERDLFGPQKPAYTQVIVEGGVNDLLVGTMDAPRMAALEDDLAGIYATARAHGAVPIALTVPRWLGITRDKIDAEDAFDAFAMGHALAVDVRSILGCPDDGGVVCLPFRRFPIDSVHWSARGHEAIAQAIHDAAFADCE